MPRVARIVIPNVPHHVTQRGNNRQEVFLSDDDRRVYLALLRRHAEQFGLDILGYSLMPNHVHLVVLPRATDSLAKAVGRTDWKYTLYANDHEGRSGHLWQNRFYSCALDEKHAVAAMRYVEENPVRARLVAHAWDHPWSSAAAHVTGADPTGLLNLREWMTHWPPKDWRQMLRKRMDEDEVSALRYSTARGRPLGSDDFVARMEAVYGRRLSARPVGRPVGWRKDKSGGK